MTEQQNSLLAKLDEIEARYCEIEKLISEPIIFINEAHFHIELGEFGLTVSSRVLITKTAGNLVVFVHSGHH